MLTLLRGDLSDENKREYIAAVQCLMQKAPVTPLDEVPGVRSRFDDFGATHLNQTASIHWTSNFFAFHRYFTWSYEKALRDECSYTGTQPYWDWAHADTLEENPLFDGSDLSVGGNGAHVENVISFVILPTPVPVNTTRTDGTGGGCITSGPFVNMSVNLGPRGAPIADGLQYNPRCLSRNFRNDAVATSLTYGAIQSVLEQPDLQSLSTQMSVSNGLHGNGHLSQGGLQDDLWTSALDPSFHFHHAAVDRVWSIWQAQNQTERVQEISDTRTIMNLDDIVDLGYSGGRFTIGELSSTIDGPFCYIYQ
ncbi:hypothetical protein HYALB_00013818 [Hymenoscyphus albidus]|uniref:Tyrosinase copper-binding domain-containing protein n=1 Tax=Hymenoscyphus albidus TaxID=595503 RepID=A0A9N9LU19_9HELO|nr:hypothetical protein HYALB_00013818 [Hymenoscyphus albidus]